MSLLMDALKRAETSKQEATRNPAGKAPAVGESLSLEPLANETTAHANPLPKLAAHIEAVDIDLANTALPSSRPAPNPSRANSPSKPNEAQEAIRNAFASKQQSSPPPSRLPLWLALGTLGLAALAIGGYVWYQLNAMNRGSLATSPTMSAGQATPPSATPAPPLPAPAVALTENSDFGPKSGLTVEPAPQQATTPLFPRAERRQPRPPLAEPETAPSTPIRLIRTRPETDSNLLHGFTSLQRGDIEAARREYEQALNRDPNNTDALLALAAIAQRQGRSADAEGLRQRALIANPADPAAQAAILNNASANADPNAAESRLKTLLSSQPESAPLNFALGNLYSRQSRWPEAQQAYFNAVAAEADNPDYLFNLAVSLDHLHQPRLAAQHYRLALEAATKRPAAFNRDKVERRLAELQP